MTFIIRLASVESKRALSVSLQFLIEKLCTYSCLYTNVFRAKLFNTIDASTPATKTYYCQPTAWRNIQLFWTKPLKDKKRTGCPEFLSSGVSRRDFAYAYAMVPKKTWFNFLVDSSRRRWKVERSSYTIGWTASVYRLPVGWRYSWSHNNDNNNCCCNDDQRGSPVIAENSMASCCSFFTTRERYVLKAGVLS